MTISIVFLTLLSIDAGHKKRKKSANLLGSGHHSLWFEAASIIGGVHSVVWQGRTICRRLLHWVLLIRVLLSLLRHRLSLWHSRLRLLSWLLSILLRLQLLTTASTAARGACQGRNWILLRLVIIKEVFVWNLLCAKANNGRGRLLLLSLDSLGGRGGSDVGKRLHSVNVWQVAVGERVSGSSRLEATTARGWDDVHVVMEVAVGGQRRTVHSVNARAVNAVNRAAVKELVIIWGYGASTTIGNWLAWSVNSGTVGL